MIRQFLEGRRLAKSNSYDDLAGWNSKKLLSYKWGINEAGEEIPNAKGILIDFFKGTVHQPYHDKLFAFFCQNTSKVLNLNFDNDIK